MMQVQMPKFVKNNSDFIYFVYTKKSLAAGPAGAVLWTPLGKLTTLPQTPMSDPQ